MTDEQTVTLDTEGLATSEGVITVYNFEPLTGLYFGSSEEYLVQGIGIPAYSTVDAPPPEVAGMVCLFKDGKWDQVADHRGETVYSTKTGEAITVTLPGDYPTETTLIKPVSPYDKWDGTSWVTDTVAAHQAAITTAETKKAELISKAGSVSQAWQTQLLLGIITDSDKALLTQWMKYYQQLQAVDTSKAPDIEWPQEPA